MNLKPYPLKSFALSTIAAVVLTACGSSDNDSDVVEPETTSLSVKVVDGYLNGAFTFLDINGNYSFDDGEPSGTTGAGGVVSLDTTGVDNPEQYPIFAEADKDSTIDEDTGLNVENDFAISSPPGSTVVNPITTLVQLTMASGAGLTQQQALTQVAQELGVEEAELLKDYLDPENKEQASSKAIHAIARSVVNQLPAQASALDASQDSQVYTDLASVANTIADEVHQAIAEDKDPDVIVVIVSDDGVASVTAPDVDDAKAFVADIRTWGVEIEQDISEPAAGFSAKLDTASRLIEADVDSLVMMLDDILLVIDQAVVAGTVSQLTPAMLYPGATGTFVGHDSSSDTAIDFGATAQLTIGDNTINFEVAATAGADAGAGVTTSSGDLSVTATLANAKVSLEITEGTFTVDGFVDAADSADEDFSGVTASLAFTVLATTLTDNETVSPASFEGSLKFDAKATSNQANSELFVLPTLFELSGIFGSGAENFEASLTITSSGDFISENSDDNSFTESADNWADAKVVLDVSTALDDFSGASIMLMLERSGLEDGDFTATLMHGSRKVELSASSDETGSIVATNDEGVKLTLRTVNVADGDQVGELLLGIKQVAIITLVNGIHKIEYGDGTFETLF